jgi:hypothetical protein
MVSAMGYTKLNVRAKDAIGRFGRGRMAYWLFPGGIVATINPQHGFVRVDATYPAIDATGLYSAIDLGSL